jgi:hypothetical protein
MVIMVVQVKLLSLTMMVTKLKSFKRIETYM